METHRSHAVSHLARPLEPTRARASKPSIVSLSGPRDGCPSTVSLSGPRDGCPSAVSLSWSPPQLNRSCISSLSDSDRLENNFDLIEVGGSAPASLGPGTFGRAQYTHNFDLVDVGVRACEPRAWDIWQGSVYTGCRRRLTDQEGHGVTSPAVLPPPE